MKTWAFQQFLHDSRTLIHQKNQQQISFATFWQNVADRTVFLQSQVQQQYALWTEDSYLFLAWLWAGAIAQKRIILPPHRIAQLEQDFAEKNIYFIDVNQHVSSQNNKIDQLVDDWELVLQQQIIFFTSGSTGQPKQIPRNLQQLLSEVDILQHSFDFIQPCCMLASVSHQHIYGILFEVLLPLMSGQAFFREQLVYPEQIIAAQQQLKKDHVAYYLIASPALLKRCVAQFDFADTTLIFSSGGKLDIGIREYYPQPIIEILGSSETGGIAKKDKDHGLWQAMSDVEIRIDEQQNLWVKTIHAYQPDWLMTGDVASLENDGFQLLGRSDRIVKLEEKRLSLDAIENTLEKLPEIQQCYALLTAHQQRDLLSVVVVLTAKARQQLIEHGKKAMIANLKKQLSEQLESIALPRLWRFLDSIPVNTQGKIDKVLMQNLFQSLPFPIILQQQQSADQIEYQLEFIPELNCFAGHFPQFPVYPGVGQIAFLTHFAQQLWINLEFCTGYEQLKFQDLIRPYDILSLSLQRKQHKVIFQMQHIDGRKIASGRLLFQVRDEQ